jgi:hypothetical protein
MARSVQCSMLSYDDIIPYTIRKRSHCSRLDSAGPAHTLSKRSRTSTMRSSKVPQARRPSSSRRPTATKHVVVAFDKGSEGMSKVPGNVEFVSRFDDNPVDSQFEHGTYIDYFNPQVMSPGSIGRHGGNFQTLPSVTARTSSPYGFVPIEEGRQQRFVSPCPSPYDFRKPEPSPSMMSVATETTVETLGMTLGSSMSPSTVSMTPPPLYRPNPYARDSNSHASWSRPPTPNMFRVSSPRPKTPTNGRKSPFAKSCDDEASRKTRIKTELCMHYVGGTPCPWGANCVYAHGEEELQMTRLLDLLDAGLLDVETYRTKPCFAWVMTGSWYVYAQCSRNDR